MKIAVYGSRRQQQDPRSIRNFILRLTMNEGTDVYMHRKLYNTLTSENDLSLPGVVPTDNPDMNAIDLVISIGGDGTLLRTVAWINQHRPTGSLPPVLGINTGHLGYLTAFTITEANDNLDNIIYDVQHPDNPGLLVANPVTMLQVEVLPTDTTASATYYALNEVVISKHDDASMITVNTWIDDIPLASYKADGLIISTPTGSTAYNLSVGGPIIQPTAPVFALTPIAAHTLTLRPLITPDTSRIGIAVQGRAKHYRLVIDGRNISLPMTDPEDAPATTAQTVTPALTVSKKPEALTILQQRKRNFARILGEKLLFNT